MAQFDVAKAVVNYRNRFLKSVIHDLLVKYGKRDILYIIAECISEIEPDNPLLITTEEDGSRWVQLEDYMYLQGSLYKNEPFPENTSGLTQRALDSASVPPVEGWKPSGNVQLGQDANEPPSQ